MGCDIHFHAEVKINGHWEHYSTPRVRRNYSLFSLLAGARENFDFPPFKRSSRNLPDDLNPVTKAHLYNSEYYSFSDYHDIVWYSFEEIKSFYEYIRERDFCLPGDTFFLFDWLEEHIGYLDNNAWAILPKWAEDVRWIIFFDN